MKCFHQLCPQTCENGLQNLRTFHRIAATFHWLAKFCFALEKHLLSLHGCDIFFFQKRAREFNWMHYILRGHYT